MHAVLFQTPILAENMDGSLVSVPVEMEEIDIWTVDSIFRCFLPSAACVDSRSLVSRGAPRQLDQYDG